jgi:hypothetical protein
MGHRPTDNDHDLPLETPDAKLSVGVRERNGVYTLRFNRLNDPRSGS